MTVRLSIVLAGVFIVVNLVNAIHKGGDFDVYVEAARRLLADTPLYEQSGIAVGFVGPPAQAVPFVVLASADPTAARLVWFGVSVVLLWYSLTTWAHVLTADRRSLALAVAGVAYPLQTQFEHQNLNVMLLALSAYAAKALRDNRSSGAGVALGIAAALKVYPAVALLWLVARRRWRALTVALAAGVAVTLSPVLFVGTSRFVADVLAWRAIAGEGWPARRANQSMLAMWGRYLAGEGASGYSNVTPDDVVAIACTVLMAAAMLVPFLVAASRPASGRRIGEELGCVSALAVLCSPIAWEHYWVAWFPVLVALGRRAQFDGSRWARWSFWVGALLISGCSRSTLGGTAARVVRSWSFMTWGGVITCATLTLLLLTAREGSRQERHFN